MKVFYTTPTVKYAGGIVLVAANSPEEALMIAAKEEEENLTFSAYDWEKYEYFPSYDSYYKWSPFEEVAGLTFDTNEPKVILSDFFAG